MGEIMELRDLLLLVWAAIVTDIIILIALGVL